MLKNKIMVERKERKMKRELAGVFWVRPSTRTFMKKILLLVVGIAVYLNIGWAIGTFYVDRIAGVSCENLSSIERAASGGWCVSHKIPYMGLNVTSQTSQIAVFSVTWPFYLICLAISWVIYWAVEIVSWIAWLIFAGGAAKLFGLA